MFLFVQVWLGVLVVAAAFLLACVGVVVSAGSCCFLPPPLLTVRTCHVTSRTFSRPPPSHPLVARRPLRPPVWTVLGTVPMFSAVQRAALRNEPINVSPTSVVAMVSLLAGVFIFSRGGCQGCQRSPVHQGGLGGGQK